MMNVGMLWFDNDPKTEFNAKIERAAVYYREKYGKHPNVCFVHPSMIQVTPPTGQEEKIVRGEIELRTSRSVLPHHFWIGVNGTVTGSSS